jgi:hypothetical protein
MALKPATKAALDAWIRSATWDSEHPEDMQRFYQFLSLYQKEYGFALDEDALRKEIQAAAQAKGHAFGEQQEDLLERLIDLAYDILDFLKATGR